LADDNSSDYFFKIGHALIVDFGKNGNPANSKFKVVLTTVHSTKQDSGQISAKQGISRHLLIFFTDSGLFQ
jgi:hypothetical protein